MGWGAQLGSPGCFTEDRRQWQQDGMGTGPGADPPTESSSPATSDARYGSRARPVWPGCREQQPRPGGSGLHFLPCPGGRDQPLRRCTRLKIRSRRGRRNGPRPAARSQPHRPSAFPIAGPERAREASRPCELRKDPVTPVAGQGREALLPDPPGLQPRPG